MAAICLGLNVLRIQGISSHGIDHVLLEFFGLSTRRAMILFSHSPGFVLAFLTMIARFMGPTWDPPGSCRPHEVCKLSIFNHCLIRVFRIYCKDIRCNVSGLDCKWQFLFWFNSLWPNDGIWLHILGSMLVQWRVAWGHQAIIWTNVELSSVRSRNIHLGVSSWWLKIASLKSHPDLKGNSELSYKAPMHRQNCHSWNHNALTTQLLTIYSNALSS